EDASGDVEGRRRRFRCRGPYGDSHAGTRAGELDATLDVRVSGPRPGWRSAEVVSNRRPDPVAGRRPVIRLTPHHGRLAAERQAGPEEVHQPRREEQLCGGIDALAIDLAAGAGEAGASAD